MAKEAKKMFELGVVLVGLGITSFQDFIVKFLYKIFDIPYEEINVNIAFVVGLILIVLSLLMMYFDYKGRKIITIIGLDNIRATDKLKNKIIINIIDDVKRMKVSNSKKIISEYSRDIEKSIINYQNNTISYFGIAPLPFVAIAGNHYRKIRIDRHYEYYQKNDIIKPLNYTPSLFLEKLKLEKETLDDSKIAIITIETTARINKDDLKQFKNCNRYSFYLEKAKTNSIVSESQLEKYSEQIVDQIYKISKTNIEQIYILAASQSSLVFEIFRKMNKNRVPKIIVCNYSMRAKWKYNWGIIVSDINNEEYVELEEVNG